MTARRDSNGAVTPSGALPTSQQLTDTAGVDVAISRRILAAATPLVALLAGLIIVLMPAPPESAAEPAPCVVAAELHAALARLGEEPTAWTISAEPLPNGWIGMTVADPDPHAYVWAGAPCGLVASIAAHEHMHIVQWHMGSFGTENFELVADCASQLIGSGFTPYVLRAGGCPPDIEALAREVVAYGASYFGSAAGVDAHAPHGGRR